MPLPFTPRLRPLSQVDVFSAQPYFGNALAVVLDGTDLSDAQMQRFAQWTRLSETTFVLPPTPEARAAGADYRLRIFTPSYEMAFAGHPTLGSCHAWLAAGGTPQHAHMVVQQCQVGLVRIRMAPPSSTPRSTAPALGTAGSGPARLAFAAPTLQRHAPEPAHVQALLAALGLEAGSVLDAQQLCNGPRHFGLWVDSAETVLSLRPDLGALHMALEQAGVTGVGIAGRHGTAVASEASDAPGLIRRASREARAFAPSAHSPNGPNGAHAPDVEVRFFARHASVEEDPVTGSFNASLAQWLMDTGHMPTSYVAAQGTHLGCAGRVYLERDAGAQLWVGGDVVGCVQGQVLL